MEHFAMFAVLVIMLILRFVIILFAIEGFCYVMKRRSKKRGLSPRMTKWVYILDWSEEEEQADRPQGKWINKGDYAECSICGAHSGTQFDGVEPIPLKTNFCPNCGSYMGETTR